MKNTFNRFNNIPFFRDDPMDNTFHGSGPSGPSNNELYNGLSESMTLLNCEAQLEQDSMNRASCELRVFSENLRRTLMQQPKSRFTYGLFGYGMSM